MRRDAPRVIQKSAPFSLRPECRPRAPLRRCPTLPTLPRGQEQQRQRPESAKHRGCRAWGPKCRRARGPGRRQDGDTSDLSQDSLGRFLLTPQSRCVFSLWGAAVPPRNSVFRAAALRLRPPLKPRPPGGKPRPPSLPGGRVWRFAVVAPPPCISTAVASRGQTHGGIAWPLASHCFNKCFKTT